MGKLQTKKMKKARFKRRFLTKSQARRMLQVDHKQFKRLCILKGIYPRQPPQFRHSMGKDKIYYITKDIRYIVTDPILEKIREYDACTKKIHSLASQRKKAEVAKLVKRRPSFLPLDETIRERYPTFTDALRDLSDALSMVALYSLIPARVESHTTIEGHRYHTTGLYEQCVEIMKRWKAVVESRVGCLQKGFLSIKGFYFQARIEDEEPMWLVPHEFAHKFPKSVEHSVMMSFLEFYVTFLNFVLFKLEHDAREAARNDASEECGDASIPQDESEHPQENANSKKIGAAHSDLPFQRLVFFTSREAAPEHVNFVVRCLGGVVAYTPDVADLTHIVMDRPTLPPGQARRLGVEYVQPQYVFDCLNARVLLPVDGYLMGEKCPPHVSPFVISIRNDPNEFSLEQRVEHRNAYSSHVPDRIHEIRRAIDPTYEKDSKDVVGGDVDDMSSLDSEDYDELYAGTEKDVHLLDSKLAVDDDDDDDDDDDYDDDDPSSESGEGEDDDDEGLDVPLEHSRSMESAKAVEKIRVKNLANTPTAPRIVDAKRAVVRDHYTQRVQASTEERTRMKKKLKQKREEERKEAAKVLLSKKVRGVYVATSISQKRQQRKAEHLDTTRREIQKGTLKVNPKHGYLEKST